MEVIVENVRCFWGESKIKIRPLTLLVGENSSGKTTFLSVLSTVCKSDRFPGLHGFNRPPFDLGGYDSVASYMPETGACVAQFRIGFSSDHALGPVTTSATYRSHHGLARLADVEVSAEWATLRITPRDDLRVGLEVRLPAAKGARGTQVSREVQLPKQVDITASSLSNIVFWGAREITGEAAFAQKRNELFDRVLDLAWHANAAGQEVLSVAPIRTKPSRTYDQFRDEFVPEGDHIPLLLAELFCEQESQNRRELIEKALWQFGRDSGLFDSVLIQELSEESRPPFQVKVTIAGHLVNLADVGYGVSQSLPIVVQSILATPGSLLLLQQPEVHLHPRAQAALGTLFCSLAKDSSRFVVETHSDYLIDRVRQEVARGMISPSDVAILFFDKSGPSTQVHTLSLDENGDVLDAPCNYRAFFLHETMNLLVPGRRG